MYHEIIMGGVGGQGIMVIGNLLAQAAFMEEFECHLHPDLRRGETRGAGGLHRGHLLRRDWLPHRGFSAILYHHEPAFPR